MHITVHVRTLSSGGARPAVRCAGLSASVGIGIGIGSSIGDCEQKHSCQVSLRPAIQRRKLLPSP